MPTPEEIKNLTSKLASEYAKEILSKQPIKAHAIPEIWEKAVADTEKPLAELFEPLIAYISKDYCIVPKSKARELHQIATNNADSLDHGLIDGLSDWVEINLGKSLFEEEK